jgi:hypothetical protein
VTRLLRKHKLAHAVEQLRLWRKNTAGFWRNYRPASCSCPVTPAAAAAYFNQKMNSFAPARPRADAAGPAGPPGPQDATSACPDTQAIAAAISRMHSTAAGIDGLPTCLLRPRLLPALERAGDQPEQPQPGGTPPLRRTPLPPLAPRSSRCDTPARRI